MAGPEIDIEKVSFIVAKALEFGAPDGTIEEDDDQEVYEERQEGFDQVDESAHTTTPDDPAYDEAKTQIDDMNDEEQCALVALAWVGRGDFGPSEWDEALRTAREQHTAHTAEYLLGMPHLPSHLRTGLEVFDLFIDDD